MYNDPTNMYENEIEIALTFTVNNRTPSIVFTYCGDNPNVLDGEFQNENDDPITITDEMEDFIRQQLWVQYTIGWAEPQSVLIDGVFVIYTLEIDDGVAHWQFHSISATDWEGDYHEDPIDLSAITQEQMREIINKADKQIGDKFVGYYPQWKDYKHIDLVDFEIS